MIAPFAHRAGFVAAAAALLVTASLCQALAAGTPARPVASVAQPAEGRPAPAEPTADPTPADRAAVARIEAHIIDLRRKLRLTPAQENLWFDVAQVMRTNEREMRQSMAARSAMSGSMSAVDDLRSFQKIADGQSDGLKRLIPSFEALYATMSPAQRKNADAVFGARQPHPARRG